MFRSERLASGFFGKMLFTMTILLLSAGLYGTVIGNSHMMDGAILEMDDEVLYYLLNEDSLGDNEEDVEENHLEYLKNELSKYTLISNEITSHDEFDGGTYWNAVIKCNLTDRFFAISYTDWEIGRHGGWNGTYGDSSLDATLREVFPKQVIVTIYE